MPRTDNNSDRPFPQLITRNNGSVRRDVNGSIEPFISSNRERFGDSFCSGSFEFELPPQLDVLGVGRPDILNRPMEFYYQTLCDLSFTLPHSARWAVFIEPHNQEYLMSQIGGLRDNYEPWQSSEDWNHSRGSEYLMGETAQRTIGCIFALGVSQAGESVGVSSSGGINGANNGFLKSPITQNRSDNSPLELIVKETNCSYTDFVLRPWSIITGHRGLHARPISEDTKATITIFELANTLPRETPIIRKIFKYYDCSPININEEKLDYESDKVIQRQIQFVYNHYTIQDGTGYGESEDFFNNSASGEFGIAENNPIDNF